MKASKCNGKRKYYKRCSDSDAYRFAPTGALSGKPEFRNGSEIKLITVSDYRRAEVTESFIRELNHG